MTSDQQHLHLNLCQSCFVDLSNLSDGFLKVVMWICQRADDDISGNEDGPPG